MGKNSAPQVASETNLPPTSPLKPSELSERERLLLERIEQIERRLAALESRIGTEASSESGHPPSVLGAGSARPREGTALSYQEDHGVLEFFRNTTINLTLDGYYSYNFNRPAGRINLLRAYDVLSNSFSLNQAAVVIERAPNIEAGRRYGIRLDLQYGQATETLQGSATNEPRPQVYRPIFQAYGTYVVPVGSGFTVDFGKWASPLGFENNYTKDKLLAFLLLQLSAVLPLRISNQLQSRRQGQRGVLAD